jgi:uncharacterized protein HemX
MTEKEKKVTTPKKPRASAKKEASKSATTTLAAKTAPRKKTTGSNVTQMKASHEQIALLAHRYWNERGRQHGHDAEDWLRAEHELMGKAS